MSSDVLSVMLKSVCSSTLISRLWTEVAVCVWQICVWTVVINLLSCTLPHCILLILVGGMQWLNDTKLYKMAAMPASSFQVQLACLCWLLNVIVVVDYSVVLGSTCNIWKYQPCMCRCSLANTIESEQWTLVRLASFTNIGESVYTVCQSVHMPYMQTLFAEVHRWTV